MKNWITWDAENGIASCKLKAPDGYIVQGYAYCAPEDKDMMNEQTGCTIAHMRASIALSKYIRDCIYLPQLEILKQFYFSINQSKSYDANNYIAKMLNKRINQLNADLSQLRLLLTEQKEELYYYLREKAELYSKIRKHREKVKNS